MLEKNLIATILTFIIALSWLRLNNFAASRGWVSSEISRKLIHIGTGPLFILCWLLYTSNPTARFFAALVPFSITMQFILVGLGVLKDQSAVDAMSRTGDRKELLKGPLLYGLTFVVLTLIYWRDNPIGIIALMMLCGGDGLADIVGRRYGKSKLPWSPNKSWAGSLAMFFGGWLLSLLVLVIYNIEGFLPAQLFSYLLPTAIIALGSMLVESLPLRDIDNLTISITALVLGHLLL